MSAAMSAKHGPLLSLKKTLTPSRSTPRDLPREIVDHTLSCHFFRRERNLEVEIEIASQRRQPFEAPAYAFAIGFELCQRRAKDRAHHHVTLVQMHDYRVENIGPIWTAGSR